MKIKCKSDTAAINTFVRGISRKKKNGKICISETYLLIIIRPAIVCMDGSVKSSDKKLKI